MIDRYENIRKALAMGPTPGPRKWWENEAGYCCVNPDEGGLWIAKCDVRNPFDREQRANAALIAACDPDTIRALLDERDALLARAERLEAALRDARRALAFAAQHRPECNEPYERANAAIDRERAKENGNDCQHRRTHL